MKDLTPSRASTLRVIMDTIDQIKSEIRPQLDAIAALERLLPSTEDLKGRRTDAAKPVSANAGGKNPKAVQAGRLGGLKRAQNARAHGVPGKLVVGEKKGEHTCPGCGRDGLAKSQGAGGYMAMHRAPCGLPCAAANVERLDPEDRADGIHSKRNCPKCAKAAISA